MIGFLHRQSVLFFGVILLLVLWGFWPSYFSRPLRQPDLRIHAHALSLTLWCLLLVVQACAIRSSHTWIHRQLGIVSPVLVLFIIATTIALMHRGMQGIQILDVHLKVLAFNVATLTVFVLFYGLAMYHRHNSSVHARYMLCTVFPLFTAFVPRLIITSRPLVDVAMWMFGGFVAVSQAGLALADVSAVVMSVWDWRSNRRLNVFPIALALLLVVHISTVTLYRLPLWKSAAEWFVNSP